MFVCLCFQDIHTLCLCVCFFRTFIHYVFVFVFSGHSYIMFVCLFFSGHSYIMFVCLCFQDIHTLCLCVCFFRTFIHYVCVFVFSGHSYIMLLLVFQDIQRHWAGVCKFLIRK